MFCVLNEANHVVHPVSGLTEPMTGQDENMGNITCEDIRFHPFSKCGPAGNLWLCEYD